MKFLNQALFLLPLTFAARVVADPTLVQRYPSAVKRDIASIQSVLSSITAQVNSLDATIKASPFNPATVIAGSNNVVATINAGITTVQASADLSDADALGLIGPTQTLSSDTNTTIQDLIAAKAQVDAAGDGCITLTALQNQKKGSDALSAAIVSKVPAALQSTAQGLSAGISDAIQAGITAFQDECTSSNSSSAPSTSTTNPPTTSSTSTASTSTSTPPVGCPAPARAP